MPNLKAFFTCSSQKLEIIKNISKERIGHNQAENEDTIFDLNNFFVHWNVVAKCINLWFDLHCIIGVSPHHIPHILISEPTREIVASSEIPPVEILFSWVTPLDNGASVFLRLDEEDGAELTSVCPDTQSVLNESNGK
jgi:hypothetical protein